MAQTNQICQVSDELKAKFKKFRRMKPTKDQNKIAWILNIDGEDNELKVEEEIVKNDNEEFFDDEFRDLLPHYPRFILLSSKFEKDDGRVLYPQILIHYNPTGTKEKYSIINSCSVDLIREVTQIDRCVSIQDSDDLTDEWLEEAMLKYK